MRETYKKRRREAMEHFIPDAEARARFMRELIADNLEQSATA
jgi:hypothetical protein